MPKHESVEYVCDVCGEPIHGDVMQVTIEGGGVDRELYVCLPRTAAINPCGNRTRQKILSIFGIREPNLD